MWRRTADKFADLTPLCSDNGLAFLPKYINSFMSLKVEQYVDLDTHGMFICSVTEARVISDKETMTYAYYQANVKPKPAPAEQKKTGWRWIGDYALPISLILGMASAIPITSWLS